MDLVLVKIGSKEWDYMWEWLKNHPINEGIEEPTIALNDGESWQYLGSFMSGNRILHQFRHRSFPKGNYIKTLSVSGSKDFNPEIDIEKKFKL